VEALPASLPPLEVACDVEARFLDAADVFAPQKGATPDQVELLRARLARLAVPDLPGAGAAGGLAGGLAAAGARLVPGFDFVAARLGFDERLAETDLLVTGEGRLDATSFTGKVVGRALERAGAAGVETLVVAGEVAAESGIDAISLVERYGPERAFGDPAECIAEVVANALATSRNRP
jgi:glycerate kinase